MPRSNNRVKNFSYKNELFSSLQNTIDIPSQHINSDHTLKKKMSIQRNDLELILWIPALQFKFYLHCFFHLKFKIEFGRDAILNSLPNKSIVLIFLKSSNSLLYRLPRSTAPLFTPKRCISSVPKYVHDSFR